ncbi:MAG TPA: phosphoribosylformylglycinamidine synthase [Flavobacteriales bacterium]|nr:phosphoribosylformylglycinamidine synthase [Flavobacteriales bacterium]|tara:strand:+ start:78656 stop:78904 length:249 start_codon:yes stop_codon:yes gene_type:complete
MKFRAEIDIMPQKAILDPQGKAVKSGLKNLGIEVEDVRIGKHITILLDAPDKNTAAARIDEACVKLLANQIMETFQYEIFEE